MQSALKSPGRPDEVFISTSFVSSVMITSVIASCHIPGTSVTGIFSGRFLAVLGISPTKQHFQRSYNNPHKTNVATNTLQSKFQTKDDVLSLLMSSI